MIDGAAKMADDREARVRQRLDEANRWRVLGLLFERPRPGWLEEIRGLAVGLADADLREAAVLAGEAGEADYLRVFGPGGGVSPREVAYRPMEDPGAVLTSLAGFYRAFGYLARGEDPPDHVAVEAGFVAYLWLKEAYALARADAERTSMTRRARERFLAEHLGVLASGLEPHLRSTGPPQLHRAAAILSRRCPPADAATPGAGRAPRALEPDGDGFDCGGCGIA